MLLAKRVGFEQPSQVEWSSGSDTKDEALARIQQREEAAVKRERAMAYAFSHQVTIPYELKSLKPTHSLIFNMKVKLQCFIKVVITVDFLS